MVMIQSHHQFGPGGTYFFTVRLQNPRDDLLARHIDLLRLSFRACRQRLPFTFGPSVVLPNRMHMIWTLPPGDEAFGRRWSLIKRTFASHVPGRAGDAIWQRRFWEQRIDTPAAFEMYANLIARAPVDEGLVKRPERWPYGSFGQTSQRGVVRFRTTDRVPSAPSREAAVIPT